MNRDRRTIEPSTLPLCQSASSRTQSPLNPPETFWTSDPKIQRLEKIFDPLDYAPYNDNPSLQRCRMITTLLSSYRVLPPSPPRSTSSLVLPLSPPRLTSSPALSTQSNVTE